jgi:hypothetical protein
MFLAGACGKNHKTVRHARYSAQKYRQPTFFSGFVVVPAKPHKYISVPEKKLISETKRSRFFLV